MKEVGHLFENRFKSKIIEEKGWVQISDESAIKEVVMKVLENNPQSIADYKAGKEKALGFLVGQAMKATKGKANPQMLNKMFAEEINKMARLLGCQFIIATHSPFMLGTLNAKIYNLDTDEYDVTKWSDLDNVRYFYNFFKKHENEFK